MVETLVVIPARGGSKGVPRKNVLPLGGKALLGWTIEAARGATSVSRVVVSTDDPEISAVATSHGAEALARPKELASDTASSESALLHALEELELKEGYRPDLLVFLQCTSPLTTSADIDGAVDTLAREGADTVLSVAPFHHFLWGEGPSGAEGLNHQKSIRLRRQDMQPQFLETGAVYVMRASGFREARHRFFGRTALFVSSSPTCEIDEPLDFEVADLLLKRSRRRALASELPRTIGALVLDFDGVMTDNLVWVDAAGQELVACNRGDGLGLAALRDRGLPLLVLSAEENEVVAARCRKLRIECQHGVANKLAALKDWGEVRGLPLSAIVYVGNDVNDVECLKAVGCGVAVSDAHAAARSAARFVLTSQGGRGAVREICDLIQEKLGGNL